MDARQRRTRAKLYGTITALAERQPVSRITATEIAREAGVHRSTFYEWAQSPAELLRDALRHELDQIRTRHLADQTADVVTAVNATTRDALRHVAAHAAIYRRDLAPDGGDAGLASMLADQFAGSSALLLRQERVRVPLESARLSPAFAADTAARYVAHGAVGAMAAWLDLPEPRDEDAFLELFDLLVPAWWPRAAGSSPARGHRSAGQFPG
jgi:AcrR family transcriptional regulator